MHAYHIGSDFTLAIGASHDAVKIFDNAKTIAAQLEVVRAVTKATIAKVEGLLTVERVARVCVRDSLEAQLALAPWAQRADQATISLKLNR